MTKHYRTDKEPDCSNCPCRRWQVALGLGIWCSNEKNKGKDFGNGVHHMFDQPLLYFSHAFVCDNYKGKIKPKLEYVKVEDLPDLPPYPFVEEELKKS